ncbi:MAG TPA: helix-turn-helix domain-containing protein [Candidatus Paceibacterota bacterium]
MKMASIKRFMGLSDREFSVLFFLRTAGKKNVSKIAEGTQLPRTTVGFILQELLKRNLVLRISVAGHYEWCIRSPDVIKSQVETVQELWLGKKDHASVPVVRIEHGAKAFQTVADAIMALSRGERVFFIQGFLSAQQSLKKFDKKILAVLHEKVRTGKIILDGVAGEKVLDLFHRMSRQELESHRDRPVISYIVPGNYFQTTADILIFRDTVLFLNYSDETLLEVRHKMIADSLREVVEFIEDHAKKIDINEYIRQRLLELSKR